MKYFRPARTLHWLARFAALGLAAVLAYASVAYWSQSLPLWNLHGLITLVALLVFALLPRTLLARPICRAAVIAMGGIALAAGVGAAAYSAARMAMVGPWPIVVEVIIVLLLAVMIFEALAIKSSGVAV